MPTLRPLHLLSLILCAGPGSALAQVPVTPNSPSDDGAPAGNDRSLSLLKGLDTVEPSEDDRDEVPPTPDAYKERARRCLQQAHQRDDTRRGRVELQLSVSEGKVASSKLLVNEPGDLLLGECLIKAARDLRLEGVDSRVFTWVFTLESA